MDTLVKMQMLFGLRHIKVKEYFRLNSNNNILFFKDFIYLFLERGEGREKERERNIMKETSICKRNINWFLLASPQLGTWPTTQACALTGIRTGDLSVCRLALNPLSRTSQGQSLF